MQNHVYDQNYEEKGKGGKKEIEKRRLNFYKIGKRTSREMISLNRRLCGLDDYKQICGEIASYCESFGGSKKTQKIEGEDSAITMALYKEKPPSGQTEKLCSEKDLIENIRTVAEVLIWEDQNEEQGFFDTTCEFDIFPNLVELVISMQVNYAVRKQSLQTLSIILQNLRNVNTLYYILSNNVISKLLNQTFRSGTFRAIIPDFSEIDLSFTTINQEEEEEDELLSYYIALLRTLALRLNGETLRLFLNETTEFPLWKNACMYINHRDGMVRNTSRNVLLNILRSGEKEIIDYILLEEIKQVHHQGQLEQVMRHIDIDSSKAQDLLRSLSPEGYSSISVIQTLISSLIKQIHQFGELAENLNFEWPDIEEYMGIIISDHQESHLYDSEINEPNQSSNISPIGPTSPITLSYTETESADGYGSPVVNQLSPSFYDRLIKPLDKQVELILDLMEFFHEFVTLEIQSISWLFCNSILHQVFEMVLFQKITNEIASINQGISRNTLLIKIYLFITYQILLFLYNNNPNQVYDSLISSIWDKFLKLGNQQTLFGNIFSTLINYLEEDSEFVLMFGLLNLYSIWGKKQKEEVRNSPSETHSNISSRYCETGFRKKDNTEPKISPEQELGPSSTVSSFLQSFVSNFSSFFHYKDDQESLIQEIYRVRNMENLSLVEIEFMSSLSPGYLQKQKVNFQRSFQERRCKSLPKSWKYTQDDENSLLYELESSKNLMMACINHKKLREDFEKVIKESELLIKKEFQSFYSKLNCEILSQELNNQGLECLLFLAQFLEKIVSISEKNNHTTKMRPLCLFVVIFLTLGVIQDHETLRQSNHFQDFCSLLNSFMKYFKSITLRHIGDLLRRDLNTGEKYSIFEKIGNLNYMICEHFLEWKDEDELLIHRLFDNHEATSLLIQRVISSTCVLPLVHELRLRKHTKRYIWNLIDTYPIFRWFPNNSCDHFGSQTEPERLRSIFIDKLRSNYNNLQILEIFCGKIDQIGKMISKNWSDDLKTQKEEEKEEEEESETEFENGTGIGNHYPLKMFRKMRILIEGKPFKVSVIRAKKGKKDSKAVNNVQCNVIFDLSRGSLVLTSLVMKPERKSIMLGNFEIIRCKPVPIITRSYKTAIRYLVALLVRYRKYELKEHVILDDFLYELPLREDLLSSPNISKGAIIQPRETKVNRRIYHLNNLLLPAYTRVGIDKRIDELGGDLSFNDYALYMEFESKKKSQEFIRKLNELRREKHIQELFGEYSKMFR